MREGKTMGETIIIKGNNSIIKNDKKLIRVCAYCRVSTDSKDQEKSFYSQRQYYTEKIKNTPGWILVDIYSDKGISGTSDKKRKDFQRMIEDCLAGKIDLIITKSLSRFTRNTIDLLKYIRLLRDRNIPVIFEEDNINTCSHDGELMLTILGATCQQEVAFASSRVKLGLKMKMKQGRMVGCTSVYGYDYNKETKSLIINPQQAEVVRLIFQRYIEGNGANKIAKELEANNIPAPRSKYWNNGVIINLIKNVKYRGDLLQGKYFTTSPINGRHLKNFGEQEMYYAEGHHDAIIEPEMFDKAQEIWMERCKKYGKSDVVGKHRSNKENLFSKRIFCASCGRVFIRSRVPSYSKDKHTVIKWRCGANANHSNGCKHKKEWHEEWIKTAFIDSVNLLCRQGSSSFKSLVTIMAKVLGKKHKEREKIKRQVKSELDKTQQQLDLLVDLNLDGNIESEFFQTRYEVLRNQLENYRKSYEEIENRLSKGKKIDSRLEGLVDTLREHGPLESFDAQLFDAVIDKVVIGDEEDGKTEFITFVYRDGECNTFDVDEIKKAIALQGQFNKVSAYRRVNNGESMDDTCSSNSKQGKKKCSMIPINQSSLDNMVTNGKSVSGVDIHGVHGDKEKVSKDRSMCKVNRHSTHTFGFRLSYQPDCSGDGVAGHGFAPFQRFAGSFGNWNYSGLFLAVRLCPACYTQRRYGRAGVPGLVAGQGKGCKADSADNWAGDADSFSTASISYQLPAVLPGYGGVVVPCSCDEGVAQETSFG